MKNFLIKNKLIKRAACCLIICMPLFLLGCARQQSFSYSDSDYLILSNQQAPMVAANRVFPGCAGSLINKLGQTIRIVIPDQCMFYPHSANLIHFDIPVLNKAAALLNRYKLEDIQVAAYTDSHGYSSKANWNLTKLLTTKQAQVVQNYLWKCGVNVRLSSAAGFGSKGQVSSNATYLGRASNRRIEISFRYYPHHVRYL